MQYKILIYVGMQSECNLAYKDIIATITITLTIDWRLGLKQQDPTHQGRGDPKNSENASAFEREPCPERLWSVLDVQRIVGP